MNRARPRELRCDALGDARNLLFMGRRRTTAVDASTTRARSLDDHTLRRDVRDHSREWPRVYTTNR